MNLSERLDQIQKQKEQGPWYPANAGGEKPFWTTTGRYLEWCWQPSTGRHAYRDCQTDLMLSTEDAMLALGYR